MASSSENYREKLIRNLEEEKVTEKYFTTDAHNQSYVTGLNEFLQRTDDDSPVVIQSILEELEVMMQTKNNKTILRICSLGCGDGKLDKLIIEEIQLNYSHLKIEFVGVEMKKISYEEAKTRLVDQDKLKVKIYLEDFTKDIPGGPFDLIMAMHSFYHIESVLDGILLARKKLNSTGTLFLSLTREGPINEPLRLIWRRWFEPIFSLRLTEVLEEANIPVKIKRKFSTTTDLTAAIQENFSKKEQMSLLCFLTCAPMELYSKDTKQSCIDYFKQEAEGKPQQHLVHIEYDYFVIHGNSN